MEMRGKGDIYEILLLLNLNGSDSQCLPSPVADNEIQEARALHASELSADVLQCGISLLSPLQVNSKGSVVLSTRCKGLWRECVWDRFVKIWTCDAFSSYLNPHPASIVLTRSLIVTSSIISSAAFLFLIVGYENFHCCRDGATKLQCLRLSSGLYFFTAMSSSAAIIRYCVYVYHLHQYEVSLKIPGFPSFEYGYSLWMAVGGNLGAVTSAVTTCYLSFCKKKLNTTPSEENPMIGCSESPSVQKTYV
ncbi:claudin-16-like [Rana temporaria]|uniref:claudin-16-like n=1 Tax=Rana temporaria TaxID=8407 RepID=UPI001AAC8D92|nr:claudin-16-like [Rana temporaria]